MPATLAHDSNGNITGITLKPGVHYVDGDGNRQLNLDPNKDGV